MASRLGFSCVLLFSVLLVNAIELQKSPPDANAPRAPCSVALDNANQWPQWPPIITDATDEPIFPQGRFDLDDRTLEFADGELINLSCNGGNGYGFAEFPNEKFTTARCIGGQQFSVRSVGGSDLGAFDFVQLGCTRQPDSNSLEPGSQCGPFNEGIIVQLGFTTAAGMEEVVNVCFDEQQSRTLYSYHVLYQENVARDTSNDSPSFRPDGYFPFDVNFYYTQNQQRITISELVGSNELGAYYVNTTGNRYLARGHLTPNSDPVYYAWQDATYYFINVAPQWQCFNAGNWVNVENGARDFVDDRKLDLLVYTGTHGVLELDDINNQKVEIYLYPPTNLPVPRYYWKVLIDPLTDTGVAFVGANNPHMSTAEIDSYKECNPIDHVIMDNVAFPDDILKGVTYACLVGDLASVFEEVPDFGNLGLLE